MFNSLCYCPNKETVRRLVGKVGEQRLFERKVKNGNDKGDEWKEHHCTRLMEIYTPFQDRSQELDSCEIDLNSPSTRTIGLREAKGAN
jgi:hypothetical protein